MSEFQAFETVKVFGNTHALTFEATDTRATDKKTSIPTLNIEGAKKAGSSFDWKNKMIFQFTPAELPELAKVLLGYASKVEFGQHGAENDKFFSIEKQAKNFFIRVGMSGRLHPVPMPLAQGFDLQCLVLKRIQEAKPYLQVTDIITMLKATSPDMAPAPASKHTREASPSQ